MDYIQPVFKRSGSFDKSNVIQCIGRLLRGVRKPFCANMVSKYLLASPEVPIERGEVLGVSW